MPMSGGKRNHEEVSDTMALVQAACKVLAITARPLAHFRHRRQPVRSSYTSPRTSCGARKHLATMDCGQRGERGRQSVYH